MKNHILAGTLVIGLILGGGLVASSAGARTQSISQEEVLAAQTAWGKALVEISNINKNEGAESAKKRAAEILDAAYGYNLGTVLFKPTLTVEPQTFRTTKEGALAYFVGQNPDFPNDTGFALHDWASVEIENADVKIYGNMAHTMGKVRLTNSKGEITEVDKTWAFLKDDAGHLRIVVHHSSLPHSAD